MVKDISSIVKPKNINRLCVLLLLLAPLVYMFGSLFTALNGAHGEMLFANETESHLDMNVVVSGDDFASSAGTYTRAFYNPSSYLSGLSNRQSTLYLGCNLDYPFKPCSDELAFFDVFYEISILSTDIYVGFTANFSGDSVYFVFDEFNMNGFCFSLWTFDTDTNDVLYYEFYSTPLVNIVYNWDVTGFMGPADFLSGSNWFFSHDSLLSWVQSHNITLQSDVVFDVPQNIPDYAPVVYEPTDTPQNAEGYSNYIFGQFFARDNWLENLGREMLDDELSYGFLPFANLLRNIDSNVLHLGGEQWACMLYGYLYYSLHVVLIDCIACILLAVPKIIFGAMDWFTKGVDL